MRVIPTDVHEELRDIVRSALKAHPRVKARTSPVDQAASAAALWRTLVQEIGVLEIAVSQGGGDAAGMAVLATEVGAVLSPAPLSATLIAAAMLGAGEEEARELLLPRLLEQGGTATVIPPDSLSGGEPSLTARRRPDGWIVSGSVPIVLHGATSGIVVAPARTETGTGTVLVAVDCDVETPTTQLLPGLDQTRDLAAVSFDDARAHIVASGDAAASALHRLSDLSALLLAAESVGGAQRCLDLTLEYVQTREQFGRKIGSFQAVKHRLADRYVDVQGSHSLIAFAGGLLNAEGAPTADRAIVASAAKSRSTEAYCAMAGETIQLHGAIGFTWEHEAHDHFKRAHSNRRLWGDASVHRERILRTRGGELE